MTNQRFSASPFRSGIEHMEAATLEQALDELQRQRSAQTMRRKAAKVKGISLPYLTFLDPDLHPDIPRKETKRRPGRPKE